MPDQLWQGRITCVIDEAEYRRLTVGQTSLEGALFEEVSRVLSRIDPLVVLEVESTQESAIDRTRHVRFSFETYKAEAIKKAVLPVLASGSATLEFRGFRDMASIEREMPPGATPDGSDPDAPTWFHKAQKLEKQLKRVQSKLPMTATSDAVVPAYKDGIIASLEMKIKELEHTLQQEKEAHALIRVQKYQLMVELSGLKNRSTKDLEIDLLNRQLAEAENSNGTG